MEPYAYRISGEPTKYDAPTDFDRQYELLHRKLQDERDRSAAIEGKAATLLAGTIAILGFSFEHVSNLWEALALFAFGWPITHLYFAYRVITWQDAPSAQEIAEKFPWYPRTTIASAALAMASSIVWNAPKIKSKAEHLNRAFVAILIVIGLLISSKVVTNLVKGESTSVRPVAGNSSRSPRSSGSANTSKPNSSGR